MEFNLIVFNKWLMLYIFTGECIPQLQSESPKIPAQRAFYFYLNTPLKRFHIASNMQVVPHMHRENARAQHLPQAC